MVLILNLCLLSIFYISAVDMTVKVENVYFSSVNFHTTLRWDAVCDVQQPCTYTVQYKVYGDKTWIDKSDCLKTQNFCDMTKETLENVKEKMMAKVYANATGNVTSANSKWFVPIRNTNISVPDVILSPSANSIVVYISTVPPLLYVNNYPKEREPKFSYIIAISNMSKLLFTEVTHHNVWETTHLAPDHYCISVQMKFEERTSNPSPKVCVNLNDLAHKEVIFGSAVAICVCLIILVILAVYLIVYRQMLHPKLHLPSNLNFNDVKAKSSASDYKSDEAFLAPSIFEGMEFGKHTLDSDDHEEHPQNKRYVSTETWRTGYVNFRQKYTDPNFPLSKTVELRNSTYGANAAQDCLLDYPSIWIPPEARYTKAKECLHYGHICNEYDYYNDLTSFKQDCNKPNQPYFNQEKKSHCLYMNEQFRAYTNISGDT
ncbi:interleukin-22 receptor subunit alpha-2 [Lithobates pipiens]